MAVLGLTRLPFSPYPLSRSTKLSLGLFCLLRWHCWAANFSSTQSGTCEAMRPKEHPKTLTAYCFSRAESLASLPFSFLLLESSSACSYVLSKMLC